MFTSCYQSLAVDHAEIEGLSRIVPRTDESVSKLVQQLYKLVDINEVRILCYLRRMHQFILVVKHIMVLICCTRRKDWSNAIF